MDCGNSTVSPGCESARYSGIVLQVNIQYNNNQEVFNFNTDRVQFRYTVDHVEESEFKGYEILTTVGDERTRTRNNRHGIRMVFRQIGPCHLDCSNGCLVVLLPARNRCRLVLQSFNLLTACVGWHATGQATLADLIFRRSWSTWYDPLPL